MKDNIQTDIEQRKFSKSVLNDLNRIASAIERLADQWEENEKEAFMRSNKVRESGTTLYICDDVNGLYYLLSKANGKKEVIDKIKNWLGEESIDFGVVEQAYADFQADLRHPHNMSVILFRNKKDSIHFETYVGFTEEDKKTYAYVKKENKQNFVTNIQMYLLMMNVGHSFDPNAENLEKIRIVRTIYFDGLTKDKFFDTISAFMRAGSIVELLMLTYLGIRRPNSNGKLTT